jgi:DNA-binding transcriptional MerR regulator
MSHARVPKGRFEPNGHCCSTLERIYWSQGEFSMKPRHQHKKLGQAGWKISEVERLTGLSRRDIQRVCYQGEGGIGLLSPKETKWGYRVYSTRDLKVLYAVALLRERGMTLPQVKREFERVHSDADAILDEQVDLLREEIERNVSRYHKALALGHAKDRNALERLFRRIVAFELTFAGDDGPDSALDLPEMELLVELMYGPGSYEGIRGLL